MYNVLEFLDSPDIREFHKDTVFTPAEQAVLIAKSNCRTVTDKIAALEEILEQNTDFQTETVGMDYAGDCMNFRETLSETIRIWKEVMQGRFCMDGCVFAEVLIERECIRYNFSDYHLYSNYRNAYDALVRQKQEYLEDEDMREIATFGIIKMIHLDCENRCNDEYRFNNKMQLVQVYSSSGSRVPGVECLLDEFNIYMEHPFRKGDIVKHNHPFQELYYGVVPEKWEKRKDDILPPFVSLDVYDERTKTFDYTDSTELLYLEFCREEELPEKQKVLELLQKVRTGEMDFSVLLYRYERGML